MPYISNLSRHHQFSRGERLRGLLHFFFAARLHRWWKRRAVAIKRLFVRIQVSADAREEYQCRRTSRKKTLAVTGPTFLNS